MKPKILILGVDENAIGGVATVNKNLLYSEKINSYYEVNILRTRGNNKISFIKTLFSLLKLRNNYDLFHVDLSSRGSCIRKIFITSLLRNKKYILHIHSGDFCEYYYSCNTFIKALINTMFQRSTKVCCVSSVFVDKIIKTFNLPRDKVVFIYNGVDVKNRNIEKKSNPLTILFMGKLIKERCIYEYLEISNKFRNDKNYRFLVAGDGNAIEWGNYNVEYLGLIRDEFKENVLNSADVLINRSFLEAFGISMVECMNHGLCIIGRNSGSIPEILCNGKNGFLVEEEKEIINILHQLQNDKELLFKMQKSAYNRSLFFNNNRFEKEFVKLYGECIAK